MIIDFIPDEEIELIRDSIPTGLSVKKQEKSFRINLLPNEKSIEKYNISFEKELTTTINFESLEKNLVLKIPSEDINEDTKKKLLQFIEYQNKNKALIQSIERLRKRMNTILTDEDRIQKNIMSLSTRTEDDRARNNFIAKLEELFNDYLEVQKESDELQKNLKELRTELDNLLKEMVE